MTQEVEIKNYAPADLPAAAPFNNPTPIVIAVTTSSAVIDLTLSAYAPLLAAIQAHKQLYMAADTADVYYRWSPVASSIPPAAVDETATALVNPLTQAAILFHGTNRNPEMPNASTVSLVVKGASATKLRIWAVA